MISVFLPTTTMFTGTGIAVLDTDTVEAVVSEELNGEFVLHLTYPTTAPAAQHLTVGNILGCSVPGRDTPQGFRIHTTTTTLDGLIQIVALHLSYDLAASVIADTNVVNKNAHEALAQILSAANPQHAFTSRSNVDAVASARIVRKGVLEAVFGSDDNAFLSRWGGEILRDNHHLAHHAHLGGGSWCGDSGSGKPHRIHLHHRHHHPHHPHPASRLRRTHAPRTLRGLTQYWCL